MQVIKKIIPQAWQNSFRKIVYRWASTVSQAGQDFWVFETLNEKKGGYFVDVGVHDGVYLSNTYLLEKRFGWNGVCIEANPVSFAELEGNRTAQCKNVCLDQAECEVEFYLDDVLGGIIDGDTDNNGRSKLHQSTVTLKTRALGDVLDEVGAPNVIDYLTIDVDGAEERVLLNFDFDRYRISCIIIERPSAVLHDHLIQAGYVLVKKFLIWIHTIFVNLWVISISTTQWHFMEKRDQARFYVSFENAMV